ncbi:alpha-L-arabinofuranosidase [Streptacidiphilus sp. MAP12-16]|uniref:LamG-like jellyroll fold domain-containing protein n=1 Tax=Streptacidiphilus sp. MAP12-16 TaxID=3156300 RepID=UPI003516FB8F
MYRSFWSRGRRLSAALAASAALLAGGLTTLATATPAAAAPTLAGHWALDEGSGSSAADSSGIGHTGTVGAGASWTAGQVGAHALTLNGTSSGNVDVPGPVVDTSQSFSVSAWVKLNSTSGYQTAVSIDGANVSGFFLQLRGDTGEFAFTRLSSDSTGAATSAIATAGAAPVTGTWYHLVGVDDESTGKLHLYVDGQPQTDAAYTGGGWKATGHTLIGRGLFGGNPVDFVNGSVDDVQVYQGALTGAQAQAINTSAHWALDEGSGATAADATGNGHTAALGSGATWATPGRIGAHALTLDGTANGTALATGPVVDTSHSFSVAAWVKPTAVSGFQTAVSVDGANVSGYYLQLRGDTGRFAFTRLAADSVAAAVSTVPATAAPTAGQWYHLVGVDDVAAGRLSLYVNGVLQGSAPYTGNWQATGDTAIGRGRYNSAPADFFGGGVDDVQVFDHALSADEVQGVVGTAGGVLSVDAATPAHTLPSTFFGVMTEDINHSGEGGLYPELIQNRSMMASASSPVDWSPVGASAIALDSANPLNTALTRSLAVSLTTATRSSRAGVANSGFWGIPVGANRSYTASFFAKATKGFTGPLTVDVEGADGTVYAKGTVTGLGTAWKQHTLTLRTGSSAPTTAAARFVISAKSGSGATLWLDNVSLFPPTYKNVKNGLRTDLMTKLAGLKPSFIREPGGNYLEGNTLATRFDWKTTIGPVWTRPGHQDDAWGYWSTDGMGLLEYLEWAESLGAQPLLAVYAGYNLNGSHVALDQLGPYVQDALDEIQYATGSTSTVWGAKRAADGHPKPFTVGYVEVGNEDFFDGSGSYDGNNGRFAQFYDAIKKAYPSIKVIATTGVTARTPDVVDQHYYQSPAWMNAHANLFDSASRSGPKIMVGEWASQEGRPTPDLNAALGDASWLTGLERNSDVITQEAYAPLLANVNSVQWNTNLIGFDALTSYGSPSYYAQSMLAQQHGDQVLTASYAGVGGLNTVVTRNSANGRIYVTVVNPGGSAQPVTVNLSGAGTVRSSGTQTVLSSAHPTDTNTISDPANVVPVTSPVTGLAATFTRTFPAYSVTVLTIG